MNVIAITSENTNVLIKPMSAVDQRVQQDEVQSKIDSSYLILKLNSKCPRFNYRQKVTFNVPATKKKF